MITGVRAVGTAEVATLEWTLEGGADAIQEEVDLLPTQIAITKKGIYAFGAYEHATDKVIAAALKKRKPTFKEPAKATVRLGKGRSAWASGFAFTPASNKDVACFGFDTTDPEVDFGGEPTTSWLCFDPTDVVGVYDGYSAYGRDVLPGDGKMASYVF